MLKSRLVAILAVVAVSVALVWSLTTDRSDGSVVDPAPVEAAEKALPTILSYDYRSLERGKRRATSTMTPSFAAEYLKTFAATAQRSPAKNKVVVRAVVQDAGLVSAYAGNAEVLAYVDQVRREAAAASPQIVQSRIIVELRKSDGRWLVSELRPF